jgi:hypothetical protein
VDFSGDVEGTFPVYGIPIGRVGDTEELGFETDPDDGLSGRKAYDALDRFPGRPARGAPKDLNSLDACPGFFHPKDRRSKAVAVPSQADLPGQAASGGRCQDPPDVDFLPRGDDGDAFFGTETGKVVREIRVFQKIQDQIRTDILWKIFPGIVDQGRQGPVDGNQVQVKTASTISKNAVGFDLSAPVLLKNQDGLFLCFVHNGLFVSHCTNRR